MRTRQDTLPEAEIYDALANRRRRETIKHLEATTGGPLSLYDLSAAIARRETGDSPPPESVRESVYNSLHQTHLPKLERLGVLSYDRENREIRLSERARDVDRYLTPVTRYGITWGEIYRTLGVGSLATVVATLADVPVVGAVDALVWATLSLVVFALTTSYQLWRNRWYVVRALRG
jgi:hypothetical protein